MIFKIISVILYSLIVVSIILNRDNEQSVFGSHLKENLAFQVLKPFTF